MTTELNNELLRITNEHIKDIISSSGSISSNIFANSISGHTATAEILPVSTPPSIDWFYVFLIYLAAIAIFISFFACFFRCNKDRSTTVTVKQEAAMHQNINQKLYPQLNNKQEQFEILSEAI